jgi:ribosomal protein L32
MGSHSDAILNLTGSNEIGTWGYVTATTCISNTTNISNIPISYGYGDANDTIRRELEELKKLFFMKVVVKCPACGQYGAAGCECKYCGHPIDYENSRSK